MTAQPKSFGKHVREILIITLGLVVYTVGWTAFLIPNDITGGGATGVGTIIYFATGFPVGYTYLIFNAILIVVAMKLVGANFGFKTIYAIAVSSLLLYVEQLLIKEPLMPNDRFLSALVGGVMSGLGIGITFGQGGSSGGTDIIAMIVTKYRNITPGRVIMLVDCLIIASSFFVLTDLSVQERLASLVYGLIVVVATAYSIDTYLAGIKQSLQLLIFSKNYEQIANRITSEMKRGATIIDGMGWYSKEHSKVILTLIRKHEIATLNRIVKEEDSSAFISVANVSAVYGKGFDVIRK